MTPVPTLECVIIIFPVVSRGCSGVQRGEVCDAAPYITVCYCYISSGIQMMLRCTGRRGGVSTVPTLQFVSVIFPVVSRGCSGVQRGEVCDAAPYITVC